jgi:hypothetical protein
MKVPGGRLGHFLAGAAVGSVIGGTAFAVTSTSFTYSSVKQGRLSIAPGGMIARLNTINYIINTGDLTAPSTDCFSTAINLPQGAIIQSITTWYKSNASSDVGTFAYRDRLTGSIRAEELAGANVVDDSDTPKSITHIVPAALRTVNNSNFAYSYWVCVGSGTFFYGARINYTYQNAGD